MTRPNAAVALESAAKARAAMQTAQQRGSAAGGQPVSPPMQQGPQRGPQAPPQRQQAPQAQPARGVPAQPAPVAYPNPDWNPRAAAAKTLQGLPQMPQVGPVALPGGMAPAGKPGGNPMASIGFDPGSFTASAVPANSGFAPPVKLPASALNDPSMWEDMTDEFEADYGSQAEQQAKQNEALAFQEQTGMTPEEMAGIMGMGGVDYGALLEGVEGADDLGLAGLEPEGWDDTAALAGDDEWSNESNPGPGWSWNDATGKWTQEALPPGVSADDPRWTYNEESGRWQLFDASGEDNLVDRDYWDEKAKGALESDVEDYMNPELENQKKQAWDQAQAANLDVAKALGSRGIGASGLAGMGMGDVFKATQQNVQGLEFDEYTRAAELRLNEIRTILSGRQGDLSAEMQKELADEAAKLEKELAGMQYAREDRDDIWQQIDNQAAALEKSAPDGWDQASLNAFKAWASTPGNDPYKAVVTVKDGKLIFNETSSDAAMTESEVGVAQPDDVGVNEEWFTSDPADWAQAYSQYRSAATSSGQQPMSKAEFEAWVLATYGKVPPKSGGITQPDPIDDEML